MNPVLPRVYENASENASQPLVNVCIAFAILETFFIIAFMLSWHFNRDNNNNNTKGVYALILVGYIFCFGGVVLGILKVTIGGAGIHAETLPQKTVRRMLQLVKAHEVIYVLSIPFPKLAVLCLYLRLFTARLSTSILYGAGLIVVATSLFGFISSFSNCRPYHAFWDHPFDMTCTMDPMTALRFYSIPNITTDVILLIIPIPALYRLNVSTLAKVGVAFTFLVSTLGIVTATLRFVTFLDIDVFDDVTYNSISTTCWTIVEPGVYLMAATVPTLRPLVRRLVSRWQTNAVSHFTTPQVRSSSHPTVPETPVIERPGFSRKSTAKEIVQTIGRKPSRQLQLDDYHYVRYGSGVFSVRTDDEESMVCTDAIVHERMGREGRNPDGTLRAWSLQPMQFSPLRTSFFLDHE